MNYSFLNQITYSADSQASPSTLNINKRIVLKTKKGTSANLKIKSIICATSPVPTVPQMISF